ncbi:uncharacterized protein LY79DRAFT_357980 [Colletotrichum navitas]|uniref:Uncharacterized protein n=1 Tax=Colletotrichum navitas TaxID=681940 RepID=A0AAD8V1Y0_9PEZI|nr:uncharacterized protein LY79DRAFT_357980 [Colletotrichum navitas]KAK1579173.1 hypothetical protein LY79DRAFT_357980 [Colletotrichum navitas]
MFLDEGRTLPMSQHVTTTCPSDWTQRDGQSVSQSVICHFCLASPSGQRPPPFLPFFDARRTASPLFVESGTKVPGSQGRIPRRREGKASQTLQGLALEVFNPLSWKTGRNCPPCPHSHTHTRTPPLLVTLHPTPCFSRPLDLEISVMRPSGSRMPEDWRVHVRKGAAVPPTLSPEPGATSEAALPALCGLRPHARRR